MATHIATIEREKDDPGILAWCLFPGLHCFALTACQHLLSGLCYEQLAERLSKICWSEKAWLGVGRKGIGKQP